MTIWIIHWVVLAIACLVFYQQKQQRAIEDWLKRQSDKVLLQTDEEAATQLFSQMKEEVQVVWFDSDQLFQVIFLAVIFVVIPFAWMLLFTRAVWEKYLKCRLSQQKAVKIQKQLLNFQQKEIARRRLAADNSISPARMTGNEGIDKGLSLSN